MDKGYGCHSQPISLAEDLVRAQSEVKRLEDWKARTGFAFRIHGQACLEGALQTLAWDKNAVLAEWLGMDAHHDIVTDDVFFEVVESIVMRADEGSYSESNGPQETCCWREIGGVTYVVNYCSVLDHKDAAVRQHTTQGTLGYTVCRGTEQIRTPGWSLLN